MSIPLKIWTSFLAIVVLSIPWYLIRGERYLTDGRGSAIFTYNVQTSTTWAAQHTIKNLGYASIYAVLVQILGLGLDEIEEVE